MELFKIGFIPIRFIDLIDVGVVTFLFYKGYNLLRGSIAFRIVLAVFVVFILWRLVAFLDLVLLRSFLDPFIAVGAVALVVLFSSEIRRFLSILSRNTLFDRILSSVNVSTQDTNFKINQLVDGVEEIKKADLGALIVLTLRDRLERFQETGDKLDAELSSRLLSSIFASSSPLHDGAVIVAEHRISAARCILPVSQNPKLPAELGLRHRAALGMSEQTHSLVLVVSEERGEISIAYEGILERDVDHITLESRIRDYYYKFQKQE